jgi:hypothetical protein
MPFPDASDCTCPNCLATRNCSLTCPSNCPGAPGILRASASEGTGNVLLTYEAHVPLSPILSVVEGGVAQRKLPPRSLEVPGQGDNRSANSKSRLGELWSKARSVVHQGEAVLAGLRPVHAPSSPEVPTLLQSSPRSESRNERHSPGSGSRDQTFCLNHSPRTATEITNGCQAVSTERHFGSKANRNPSHCELMSGQRVGY